MKKKLNLTFVGEVDVTNYGVFIGNEGFETVIFNSMRDGECNERFLGRVALTIEPLEDGGLHVEAE